ncbi:MAG: preprotein translocase subunit SecY [Candidatus Kapabacteria bacterium]|nr:preprotein translocase subunit SecY [Candidatus Kapabacteria bacterium]
MANFIETTKNIFKIEELRKRIIFTALMLVVVRVGSQITLPGINIAALTSSTGDGSDGLLGLYDMFVGGAFSNAAIFAMGIMPYISASIILQLAAVFMPEIAKMQREGEEGRRRINQWTRYLTVLVAMMQAIGIGIKLQSPSSSNGEIMAVDPGFLFMLSTTVLLTAGTVFLMWIGEQITERGLGNGISLIIFIGIVSRLPVAIQQEISLIIAGSRNLVVDLVLVAFLALIVMAVVLLTQGARKIPVQYAKRVEGRKQMGGHTTYIPLRVNTAGVMPIIFASAVLFIPGTLAQFFPESQFMQKVAQAFSDRSWIYALLFSALIVFFTYFYTAIAFNPRQTSEDLKRAQGFIPGVRPGKPTADYFDYILTRITLPGAIFLAVIALLPVFVTNVLDVPYQFAQFFGGTSLLIVVGVALDTLQQIESYLLMRHYDGFMKSGKIQGRVGGARMMAGGR